MEGNINALRPEAVKNPVVQKPRSTTSPLPKDGSTPNITEKMYISIMPIIKVGRETPASEITKIILETKLSRLIPVYTPKKIPVKIAIKAETKTNSKVAGILSEINSDTGLFS